MHFQYFIYYRIYNTDGLYIHKFQLNKILLLEDIMPNEATSILCKKSITETRRFLTLGWCKKQKLRLASFTGRNLLWEKNNISQPNCLNQGKGGQNRLCWDVTSTVHPLASRLQYSRQHINKCLFTEGQNGSSPKSQLPITKQGSENSSLFTKPTCHKWQR